MQQIARRRTLTDDVYDALRRQIVTLDLLPGAALVDKDLSEQFGVSRTPLREAILRLVQDGLVIVAPQYATFVAPLNPVAVREAHFLRENLELPVLRQLCGGASIDLSGPHQILIEQRLLLNRGTFADFLPLDDRFHQLLFQLAGLDKIWNIIHAKKAQLDRVRHIQAPQDGKIRTLIEEHTAILAAIAAQDSTTAETVLRRHISGAVGYLGQLAAERPELFALPEGRGRTAAEKSHRTRKAMP
ncbi:MAG: GntR family transcriptional regulator [Paracoccus sp. (in: a-proteobacteria)]|uniref:GntR family transcriptional regulator n=1 Tax=Paracoccus sp. TaxID=267 RepID=UPI0026DFABB2|nr:GntR family transcriptional regulator [Paracoccus sp. (in: a-proteobacteria)]MDO5623020.1 GntR family transcriptional regulator [Paracoccus sp. (in: a-proteobacteria)]